MSLGTINEHFEVEIKGESIARTHSIGKPKKDAKKLQPSIIKFLI